MTHSIVILTGHLTCNQFYCTVVYILIIRIAIFCHGTNPSGHVGTRTMSVDYWYRRSRFESPRGQMFFFQYGSLTKYCTIYNWHLTPLLKFSMQLTLQSKWSGASDATRLTLSVWYSVPDAARKTYLKFQVSCKYQNEWLIIPFSTEWVNQTYLLPS